MWKGVSSISITYPRSSHFIESKLVVHIMNNYWSTLLLWTLTFLFTSHFHRIYLISSFMVNHKVLQPRVCKQIYFINKQKRQEAWLLKWFYSSRKLFLSEMFPRVLLSRISKWQVDETFSFEFILIARNYWISSLSSPQVSYSCICNIIWIGNILQKKSLICMSN